MKTLKLLFTILICAGLMAGCSQEEALPDQNDDLLKSAQPHLVTLPFKADFVNTYLEQTGPDPVCGEWNPAEGQFWMMVYGEGGGNATHLGKFTHHFEFCCDWATGIYPGPSDYIKAWFVAANGDSLFLHVEGQVMDGRLDHHPEDVNSYFVDPWEITGGTGMFEGASGHGMTDDYNRDSYPENSFHHWTGEITLVKGKR
ncbi:hypothetical protein [Draconibacterium sp.]|uniref:hypothetical protein n=1 Tax=Draconibacterium sp. TaxID=1965318 RepID=UPI0035619FD4